MIDRRNRLVLILLAVVLLAGGVGALLLGAGVFSQHRSKYSVVTHANLHRWDAYGAKAYAVAGAIGFVLFMLGYLLASREWQRNDGKKRAAPIIFPIKEQDRGQTTLNTPALSHALEGDLKTIPDVSGAMVGLFGAPPEIELRGVLDVTDQADLQELPKQFEQAMSRFARTVGFRPDPIQVTLRFRGKQSERRLE
jgi:hypothetical protein